MLVYVLILGGTALALRARAVRRRRARFSGAPIIVDEGCTRARFDVPIAKRVLQGRAASIGTESVEPFVLEAMKVVEEIAPQCVAVSTQTQTVIASTVAIGLVVAGSGSKSTEEITRRAELAAEIEAWAKGLGVTENMVNAVWPLKDEQLEGLV